MEERNDNQAPLLQQSVNDPWARLNAVRGASPRRSGLHSSPFQASADMSYQRPMDHHMTGYGISQDRLNIPGISDYQPVAPISFSPSTSRRSRPRFVYDQHRCRVCVPPLSVITIAVGMVAVGVLLLLPSISLRTVFHLDTFEAEVGDILAYCLIGVGSALPLLSLLGCVWYATPTRAQWQVKNNKADALLEEMTGVVQLAEHYDVIGAENAANGTVVLLAGASCPRITMQSFANAIGVHYRAILIDLPGHGSLVNVAFSLARSERVLAKVLERELHLTAGQLSVSGGVTDADDTTTTGAPKPSAAVPISAKAPPAGTRPPGFNASGLQLYQGVASLPSSAGYIASPRTPVEFLGVPPTFDTGNPSSLGSIRASIGAADLFRIAENPNDTDATPGAASPGRETTAASSNTPKETDAIRKSVVIVSYGASAYVAAYLARRHPILVAGLALMGPIPDYNVPGCCTGAWESMYRLRWAASLVNLGIKGRIRTHPKATDTEKKELLAYDWHVGMLPDFISEVHASTYPNNQLYPLLYTLSECIAGSGAFFNQQIEVVTAKSVIPCASRLGRPSQARIIGTKFRGAADGADRARAE
jgi:pimeloyl-ACP methyl ester carboxylesterase